MKQGKQWGELAAALILSAGITVGSGEALANEEAPMEKCYGIAKKGMNACGTKYHSCAGVATTNNDPDEWILVAEGTCKKLGGTLKKED
ncbi:MAG: DUF2282 domain-containing protein [Gammaproteobacteria bacterium]|jgi:uncharacterized membrane protein|nr:DUF2282 domain-containing protein [Gammaproteobacteria bacterium]